MEGHGARLAPAVVIAGQNTVDVAAVSIDDLGPGDVLIRTHFSGVSTGTDKWVMQGSFQWLDLQFPLVPGYQRFGVVEATGDDVSEFVVGQQVAATSSRPFLNAFPAWGAHAALAVSPREEVFDATGQVPERACLLVSGQVGYNAASRIPDGSPQRVVVYGDGIIGAAGALAAKARGFEVLLVGRHAERLDAVSLLEVATVRSGAGSFDAVREFRPTAVIDTVQNDAAFAEYVDALPPQSGVIVFSGHSPGGTTAWADMEHMQKRELTACFVSGWTPERLTSTLALMRAGDLPLETLVGPAPSTPDAIRSTMLKVVAGTLRPVGAVIDWRQLG